MTTTRRLFTKQEKMAMQLFYDKEGEADHIIPHSAGGVTAVENCQILSPETNRRKGAFVFEPRKWQMDFFDRWQKRQDASPFLLVAIPGSGKTMAALECARRWVAGGDGRKLIIVVPTDNLRTQWINEAHLFGLNLEGKDFAFRYRAGFDGRIVTYAGVPGSELLLRKLCSHHPTMVIFDEIHHCGDQGEWGKAITNAFDLAEEKLLMSGTPWKTNGNTIPFVRYDDDGYPLGDYSYDYVKALCDGVIRNTVFQHSSGELINDETGDRKALNGDVEHEEASARLRHMLRADGNYVRELVRRANQRLEECRVEVPDAGGLALCIDMAHAKYIAGIIREETGKQASIIVGDERIENDTVAEFAKSKRPWLVSVRKVSEGTDIKRLKVLCYLTNVTSELFFRQAIGRVSRVRGLDCDEESYVYLPAHTALIECAKNIENCQAVAATLEDEDDTKCIGTDPCPECGLRPCICEREKPQEATYSTSYVGTDSFFIGNKLIQPKAAEQIEVMARKHSVSYQRMAEILNDAKEMLAAAPTVIVEDAPEKPMATRCEEFRRQIKSSIARLRHKMTKAKGQAPGFNELHVRFNGGHPSQARMSEAQLAEKLRKIQEAIKAI